MSISTASVIIPGNHYPQDNDFFPGYKPTKPNNKPGKPWGPRDDDGPIFPWDDYRHKPNDFLPQHEWMDQYGQHNRPRNDNFKPTLPINIKPIEVKEKEEVKIQKKKNPDIPVTIQNNWKVDDKPNNGKLVNRPTKVANGVNVGKPGKLPSIDLRSQEAALFKLPNAKRQLVEEVIMRAKSNDKYNPDNLRGLISGKPKTNVIRPFFTMAESGIISTIQSNPKITDPEFRQKVTVEIDQAYTLSHNKISKEEKDALAALKNINKSFGNVMCRGEGYISGSGSSDGSWGAEAGGSWTSNDGNTTVSGEGHTGSEGSGGSFTITRDF